MPIQSPFIGACLLGLPRRREEPSELEVLARQLEDMEKDKFRKPKNDNKKRNLIWYERSTES